jgi:hypothetical protein
MLWEANAGIEHPSLNHGKVQKEDDQIERRNQKSRVTQEGTSDSMSEV